MESEVEFYVEVLKLLGKRVSVRQLRVLCFIIETKHFSVPDMVDVTNISRTDLHPAIRYFERLGVVDKIPKPELPEDFGEWSAKRRKRYREEFGITRRNYYRFNPVGIVKAIDRKIEQLTAMKARLIEEDELGR